MPARMWRSGASSKLLGVLLAVASATLGTIAAFDWRGNGATSDLGAMIFTVLAPVTIVAALWLTWWPRITVTPDAVVVRNPARQHVLPLTWLVAVNDGQKGVELRLRDGRVVVARVARKGSMAHRFGLRTRSDEIVAYVAAAIDQAHQREGTGTPRAIRRRLPHRQPRPAQRLWLADQPTVPLPAVPVPQSAQRQEPHPRHLPAQHNERALREGRRDGRRQVRQHQRADVVRADHVR